MRQVMHVKNLYEPDEKEEPQEMMPSYRTPLTDSRPKDTDTCCSCHRTTASGPLYQPLYSLGEWWHKPCLDFACHSFRNYQALSTEDQQKSNFWKFPFCKRSALFQDGKLGNHWGASSAPSTQLSNAAGIADLGVEDLADINNGPIFNNGDLQLSSIGIGRLEEIKNRPATAQKIEQAYDWKVESFFTPAKKKVYVLRSTAERLFEKGSSADEDSNP